MVCLVDLVEYDLFTESPDIYSDLSHNSNNLTDPHISNRIVAFF